MMSMPHWRRHHSPPECRTFLQDLQRTPSGHSASPLAVFDELSLLEHFWCSTFLSFSNAPCRPSAFCCSLSDSGSRGSHGLCGWSRLHWLWLKSGIHSLLLEPGGPKTQSGQKAYSTYLILLLGGSSVCILLWIRRWLCYEKVLLHWLHSLAFSLGCILCVLVGNYVMKKVYDIANICRVLSNMYPFISLEMIIICKWVNFF